MPSTGTSGKAARMVLRRQLVVARRGAELLSRKRQALLAEQRRLRDAAAASAAEWAEALAEAERWLARAALLDGAERDGAHRRLHGARRGADDRLGAADGHRPAAHRRPRAGTRAAHLHAGRELGPALRGARLPPGHPSSRRAGRRADRARTGLHELAAVARRSRAIERRWIPRHEADLAALELSLEETEREEAARLRLLARRREAP